MANRRGSNRATRAERLALPSFHCLFFTQPLRSEHLVELHFYDLPSLTAPDILFIRSWFPNLERLSIARDLYRDHDKGPGSFAGEVSCQSRRSICRRLLGSRPARSAIIWTRTVADLRAPLVSVHERHRRRAQQDEKAFPSSSQLRVTSAEL